MRSLFSRSSFAWGLLVLCAVCLQIDMGALVGVCPSNVPREPGNVKETSGTISGGEELSREFLTKQYGTAVEEIRRRIEQENLLFGLKFSLVGAILALLFTAFVKNVPGVIKASVGSAQSPTGTTAWSIAAGFCWAAVIASAIIDTRILFHADMMGMLGTWIRTHVEPALLGKGNMGWESYLDTDESIFRARAYPLLRLNAHLLTIVLFVATTYAFSSRIAPDRSEQQANMRRRLNLAGACVSFVAFFLVGIHYHYRMTGWLIWCGFWLLMGLASSAWLWRPKRRMLEQTGEGAETGQSKP